MGKKSRAIAEPENLELTTGQDSLHERLRDALVFLAVLYRPPLLVYWLPTLRPELRVGLIVIQRTNRQAFSWFRMPPRRLRMSQIGSVGSTYLPSRRGRRRTGLVRLYDFGTEEFSHFCIGIQV